MTRHKIFEYRDNGEIRKCVLNVSAYSGKTKQIFVEFDLPDGDPWTYVTIALKDSPVSIPWCSYVDEYNNPGISKELERLDFAAPYEGNLAIEYGGVRCPLYVFNKDILREYDPDGVRKYEDKNSLYD